MERHSLACVTWNLHRGVGHDGRLDPDRTLATIGTDIAGLSPDVLALQEADSDDPPHAAVLDMTALARVTGLHSVHDDGDMRWGAGSGGYLGNILLLGPALELRARRIVELPGNCPRAAVMVEVETDGRPLRIVSCHLSLGQALRAVQLRLIGQVIARRAPMQTILLGDLNEWRPWGGLALSRRITGLDLSGPARRTFPATRPLLPLDRILSDAGTVHGMQVLDSPAIRAASDHRPLAARVTVGEQAG